MDVTISWTERINESSQKKCPTTSAAAALLAPYPGTSHLLNAQMQRQAMPALCVGYPMMARMSYDMSLRTHALCQDGCGQGMPGDQNHAIDACSTGACSGDVSPYDSGDDGVVVVVGGGGDELNAGEAVDMKLFERWTTSEAGLRVDAGELEQFGRSKSF